MVFLKETVLAGIFFALSAPVSAQTHFHGAWSVGSKYAISSYNFSANQTLYALMPVAQGDVRYASFYLSQPSNKCFIVKTMPWGSAMDTKIWSNDGTEAYSDDYQGGTSRYAEFLWWSSANPLRFRMAAYSPAYNAGAFELTVQEVNATTEAACSGSKPNISFLNGETVVRYF